MALTDKLNTAFAELTQAQEISKARAVIQQVWLELPRIDAELQAIADSGSLNTADAEIKSVLLKAWNVIKTAKTGFEDVDVVELMEWRP